MKIARMKIVIVFNNGFQLPITCEEFTLNKDVFGNATEYEIKGITDNKPIYFDLNNVMCIYRAMEHEKGGEQDE